MDSGDTCTASISSPNVNSPTSSPMVMVVSPCAACKILRRRCADKCVLAPYFPPTDPLKFTVAHRVFGASNIIKFLQELPEWQRSDAVSSMVYEANARIMNPVYGCAGAICHLQKQVNELQAQLAKAQAQLLNMHCQQANLVALLCAEIQMGQSPPSSPPSSISSPESTDAAGFLRGEGDANPSCFIDDTKLGSMWDPLWT